MQMDIYSLFRDNTSTSPNRSHSIPFTTIFPTDASKEYIAKTIVSPYNVIVTDNSGDTHLLTNVPQAGKEIDPVAFWVYTVWCVAHLRVIQCN